MSLSPEVAVFIISVNSVALGGRMYLAWGPGNSELVEDLVTALNEMYSATNLHPMFCYQRVIEVWGTTGPAGRVAIHKSIVQMNELARDPRASLWHAAINAMFPDWTHPKASMKLRALTLARGDSQPFCDQIASPPKRDAEHSTDFTMVQWFGTQYSFALGVQSSAVKALWKEWERSGLGLHQDSIRNAIDAERDRFRMDKAFRNHPAFGTMIQSSGDGRYKLVPPNIDKVKANGLPHI